MLASFSSGGMIEEVAVEASRAVKIPDSMPFDEASAFLMTYGASLYALQDRGHLQPGETLRVLGVAGGVGLAAVELGKAMGARVIAAESSREKSIWPFRAARIEGWFIRRARSTAKGGRPWLISSSRPAVLRAPT